MANYDGFAIFPALNVARVGGAEDYYVGSEIPGVYVGKGNAEFSFKNDKGRIKPQAARFRIYGYIGDEIKGEINPGNGVTITWTVMLANKKAAHKGFFGINNQDQKGPIRNADWPYDRTTLETNCPEQELTFDGTGDVPTPKDFKARVYRNDENKGGHELYLGKMIMEKEGSLLIIGGKGKSGSIKDTLITNYANNDYWYDDTSDGSVDATVTIGGSTIPNKGGKSWVLVAPPKFAPGIPSIVSLYQTILGTQHPVKPDNPVIDPVIPENERDNVEYYRDIRPIFEAICRNSWVNEMGHRGHGPDKPGNFLDHELEQKLSNPLDKYKDLRKGILSRVRIPADSSTNFEYNGQAYDYFMPPLSGDDGDAIPGSPDTYLTLAHGQYLLLKKWADGDFIEGNKPQYNFMYKIDGSGRQPKYLNGNKTISFEEVFGIIYPNNPTLQVSQQVKFLNKAALEWCVGGAFFPGIEMTYLAYDENTFIKGHDFRINPDVIKPGDINAYMALPWQADFNECNTNWWPAQRPDITISEVEILKEIREMKSQLNKMEIKDEKAQNARDNIIKAIDKMKQINWDSMKAIKTDMEIIFDRETVLFRLPSKKKKIIYNKTEDVKKNMRRMINKMDNMSEEMKNMHFVEWTRGFRNDEPDEPTRATPKWGDMDMVRVWNSLGFIVEKQIPNNINAFVEVERGEIYELKSKDILATLDNLHSLLNIALQVELSTIPPYLYALYSIKPGTNIDDITDMIKYKIRHIAAEEMLHASLVANLIAAIGRKPVFYSRKMIPFYPNPLPHFRQGLLMVHLSKADEKNFDTFIKIEEPEAPSDAPPPDEPDEPHRPHPPPELPVSINSVGELYKLIKNFFEEISNIIEYEKKFQLEPGMGYAPSTGTGNDGLIVVDSLKEANRAIDLIINQGEGKPLRADMTIIQGNFDGKIIGETRVENNEIKIEGIIEGNVKGSVSNDEGSVSKVGEDGGEIEGKIEKARIQGIFDGGKIKDGKIIEGIIKGVTKFNTGGQTIKKTIERIIEEGSFEVDNFGSIEGIKFEKSIKVVIKNAKIEEYSHYNTFKFCKLCVENASESEYRLWPVIEDPNVSSYIDPKIIATATAFNAAYSYLMLLLQNAWSTDNQKEKEKKELVIGGMPALMHGVLKPIATFLAETPISADTNAGATFGYYEFTNKSSLKQQLIAAVQEASKAFPDSDKLTTAANVVTSLPDISKHL